MKRSYFIFFAIISLFFLNTISASGQSSEVNILYDNLNVREGPGTEYNVIKQVHKGEAYKVTETKGEWIKIDLGDYSGWIISEFAEIIQVDSASIEQESLYTITIDIDHTHIRQEPSIDSKIMLFAKKNQELMVLDDLDDWLKVESGEDIGYIHKSFVENNNPSEINILKDKTIVIDPGHGGYDVGAISFSGLYEKDFSYTTSSMLKNVLTSLGVNVIMTRKFDEYIRLGSRVSLSNLINPDLFISIHYNSFPEIPSANGISTYYYDDKNKKLAETIQKRTIIATGARNRDALFENLQVLRHNHSESVLIELGFISNEDEEKLLRTDEYQHHIVEGIIDGLIEYYTHKK